MRPIFPSGRRLHTLALAATVLVSAGTAACFRSDTVIHVKADGTGTIELTNLANQQTLAMAAGMVKNAAQEAGSDASKVPSLDKAGDLFDDAKIREMAATFGEGVRYMSSEPLTQDGLTGVKALFAFDDIRLINMSNGAAAGGPPVPQLRFDLQRATDTGASTLRIRLPQPARPPADGGGAPAPATPPRQDIPPEALAMVRGMFKGARISVAVEVDGAIVTTDAPARDGSRVTVFGLDIEQLLSDPEKVAGLSALKPGADFTTVRTALEGVPGVVMPAMPTVSIEFR